MRHTVVISDIHLSQVERTDGAWMRYRQGPYLPDREIAQMLSAVRAELQTADPGAPRDELTVVLNGDIFDFDAPHVINGESVFHDMPRTAEHTVPALTAILDDHPIFVEALGHVLAEGHQVVVLAGNHDVALTLPEVAALLTDRLTQAAAQTEEQVDDAEGTRQRALAAKVTLRPWFHRTADGILIEHGNQYDRFCTIESPMTPFGDGQREIPPTVGTLATRHIAARFGYFNLHDDRSFMLSPWGYVAHWARHYLFSHRSPLLIWFVGTLRILTALRRHRRDPRSRPPSRRRTRDSLLAYAAQTGASLRAVVRHARLFARPITNSPRVVLRELWVDRAAIVSLALLLGVLAWLLLPGIAGWAWIFAPIVVAAYARLAPKEKINEAWLRVDDIARRIASIHGALAVVLGHTHRAFGRWEGDLFLGNSGSWAALPPSDQAGITERRLIWLKSDPARPEAGLFGGLYAWINGRVEPRQVRAASFSGAPGEGSLLRHHPREQDAGDRHREREQKEPGEAHPLSDEAAQRAGERGHHGHQRAADREM
jgi:UDP-2,3-diacylglucosamine pyrophosphatase LpxH